MNLTKFCIYYSSLLIARQQQRNQNQKYMGTQVVAL
jgi:hypothetical protein